MLRPLLLAVATLLTLAACARDLAVPGAESLAVDPAATSAAPREALRLVASGGAGGRTFRFAAGGRLSGDDAFVDPSTGAYRAGARGSAQDLVEVVDATGKVAVARIGVGARLALAPALAGTAPGGRITFVPAGGKPPYVLTLEADPASGSTLDAAGHYVAGPGSGDAVERVVLADATGDPAARATAEIRVGRALAIIRAGTGALAPGETTDVVALGGQPPYTYSIAADGSGGARIDAAGRFRAGRAGPATDRVSAEDANGEVAFLEVPIGASLRLGIPAADVRPDLPVQLTATGGKPPYAFGFAPLGNRSGGRVAQATGEYVPGAIVYATDRLEVMDATGAVTAVTTPPLDGRAIPTGTGTATCGAGDLNGDGRADAILAGAGGATVQTWSLTTSGPEHVRYWLGGGVQGFTVTDLDGDGRVDVVLDWKPYLAQPDGHLGKGPSMPLVGEWPSLSTLGVGPQGPGIYTNGVCWSAAWGGVGFGAWDWSGGAPTAACLPLPGPFSGNVLRMAAANHLAGGAVTLALVVGDFANLPATDPLLLTTRGPVALGPWVSVPLPAGLAFAGPPPYAPAHDLLAARSEEAPLDDFAVLLVDSAARTRVGIVRNGTFLAATIDPDPDGPPATGLVPLARERDRYVLLTWNGVDGRLGGVEVTDAGEVRRARPTEVPLPYPVTCAAVGDLTGDRLPDVVAAGASSPIATVLPGDGLTIERRPQYPLPDRLAIGDLEGDGLDELLSATLGPSFKVEHGSDHQLAAGAEVRLARRIGTPVLLGGSPAMVAWLDAQDGLVRLAPLAADGTLGAPEVAGIVAGVAADDELYGADLGGSAAGDDLWGRRYRGQAPLLLLALRRLDGGIDAAELPGPAGMTCKFAPAAAQPGPAAAFVALCLDQGAMALFRAALDAGPTGPTLGPWEQVALDVGGGRYLLGQDGGRAAFLLDAGATGYVVRVGPAGPPELRTLSGLDSVWGQPVFADVDGDGAKDVVIGGTAPGWQVRVYYADGAGGFLPPVVAAIRGELRGAIRTVSGAPRDLLVQREGSMVLVPAPRRPAP